MTGFLTPMMSPKQKTFINDLLENRVVPDELKAQITEVMPSLTLKQASDIITRLIPLPKKAAPVNGKWVIPDEIPDSRYAVVAPDNKTFRFYQVVTRNEGMPNQRRVLVKLVGAPGDFRQMRPTVPEWHYAMEQIGEDPGFASQLFGIKCKFCGICGSPLTNKASIELGIGPICAKKFGDDFL